MICLAISHSSLRKSKTEQISEVLGEEKTMAEEHKDHETDPHQEPGEEFPQPCPSVCSEVTYPLMRRQSQESMRAIPWAKTNKRSLVTAQ